MDESRWPGHYNTDKKINDMKSIFLMVCVVMALFIAGEGRAQGSNAQISIQGVLRDGQGVIVPNGPQSIKFKLFTAESGGTALWEEEATVSVKGGIYSHLMGSVNPLNPILFGQTIFVGVFVDNSELLPRTELTYSPYTVHAQYAGNGAAPGSVTSFAGATLPSGWLLCNGEALSSADYPILFAVLGTKFGDGSGGINGGPSKDFNLPDLRGEFIRGLDNGKGVDANRVLGTAQGSATKAPTTPFTATAASGGQHHHTFPTRNTTWIYAEHSENNRISAAPTPVSSTGTTNTSGVGDHSHTVNINSGGDPETRPRNFSLRYIIKY
ncbi:MAG: hypothetical protein RI973_1045 [Bacteroidota bacterium]|jgi:microcystin-dependent protein